MIIWPVTNRGFVVSELQNGIVWCIPEKKIVGNLSKMSDKVFYGYFLAREVETIANEITRSCRNSLVEIRTKKPQFSVPWCNSQDYLFISHALYLYAPYMKYPRIKKREVVILKVRI